MTQKRISPYVRLREEWREWVRTMFRSAQSGRVIYTAPATEYQRGAIGAAQALGQVCIATVEGGHLVLTARPVIKAQSLPYDIREDYNDTRTA